MVVADRQRRDGPQRNGTTSPTQNFDFIQDSEDFTVSGVFNVPALPTSGSFELVGNNADRNVLSGFDLLVDSCNLTFDLSNGNGSTGTTLDNQTLATLRVRGFAADVEHRHLVPDCGRGRRAWFASDLLLDADDQRRGAAVPGDFGDDQALHQYPSRGSENLSIGYLGGDTTATDNPIVNFNDVALFNQVPLPARSSSYSPTRPILPR